MDAKTLVIRQLARFPQQGVEDELNFDVGVNVLAGPPNTGKTKWLKMLDYLMGDSGTPENAFGEDMAAKYESIRALFRIGEDEITVERRWHERGAKGKIFVDGEPYSTGDFSHYLLERLGIPILHFPQGNPYSERAWPELSWRTLLRHIYRQQGFWSDIANKQPEGDQHACLMMFLGLAEHIFSPEHGDLVEKRKQAHSLRSRKEQFLDILREMSKEIVKDRDVQVALTAESIDVATARLKAEAESLQDKREAILKSLLESTATASKPEADGRYALELEQLGQTWANLQADRDAISARIAMIDDRLKELEQYRSTLRQELARLERTRSAGQILADLKVTHCPACDQAVQQPDRDDDMCFLCHQPRPNVGSDARTAAHRIDFELEQLREETREADELIAALQKDGQSASAEERTVHEAILRIESQLRPVRQAAASMLPPEIAVLDMETGQLQERMGQLERMKGLLDLQADLSARIDRIEAEVKELERAVLARSQHVNLEEVGDVLQARMNTYLNALNSRSPGMWSQAETLVRLGERTFDFTIGTRRWGNQLGGTLILYFLLSYHYGLLSLISRRGCHYPGLLILDFPATLDEGATMVTDKENDVLKPFVDLVSLPGMEATQVIAAGRSFEGLEGVNRIELSRVWS